MTLLTKIALIVVSVPVVSYLAIAVWVGREGVWEVVFGPLSRQPVDFATLQLTDKPNQYLVCPPDFCRAAPHTDSPVFDLSVDELQRVWFQVVEDQPRAKLIQSKPEKRRYDFEDRTAVLLFPDTVTVRFIPLGENRSTLAVYSRSHYGYSDLGVNKRRVTRWLVQAQAIAAKDSH